MTSDRMLVATRKGLFTLHRSGSGWDVVKTAFLADNVPMVMHDPRNGHLYAALSHGHFGNKLHRSTDGGDTWDEVTCPAYPEMPEGVEPTVHPMTGKTIPWSLVLIWELQPGGPDQDGLLWCGTLPGGLFKSTDHGESWELVRSLWDREERAEWFGGGYDEPGIHSVVVDPRDANNIIVGISCGGAWLSTDGGNSWESRSQGMRAEYMPPERAYDQNIQDPHLVAQCTANPDALWVQHHNGLFRSVDRGANWTEMTDVEPSTFGFAVAAHPTDADTAWFVPAIKDEKRIPVDGKLVVTRTTDGGRSFESLTNGLPQRHAYDLVYRHALAVDETGDNLAFGSTTGSLWDTTDGGDSWNTITSTLPPIYTVRFF